MNSLSVSSTAQAGEGEKTNSFCNDSRWHRQPPGEISANLWARGLLLLATVRLTWRWGMGTDSSAVGRTPQGTCSSPHPHPRLHLREREGHAVVRLLGDTKPCRTQPLSAPMQQWAASRGPGTGWDSLRRLVSPLPRDGALRFPAVSSPSPGPLVQAWGVQAGREVEALLCLSLAVFLMLPAPQVLWPRHSLSWDSGHSGHCWWVSPRGMGWPGHPLGSWKVRSCTSKASGPLPSGRMVPGSLCSPLRPRSEWEWEAMRDVRALAFLLSELWNHWRGFSRPRIPDSFLFLRSGACLYWPKLTAGS